MRTYGERLYPSIYILIIALMATTGLAQTPAKTSLRFEISFPATASPKALDGHIMLCISKEQAPEPRFLLQEEEAESQQFFGLDVDGLAPGATATIDGGVIGYPLVSLEKIPAGDYYVQAVLNVYETFQRADGHTVKLPPDMGEGQHWERKPGNLLSKAQKLHIDPAAGGVVRISMTEKIPPVELPNDTKYVKHFRIQSKLLSDFWGKPMYLGAIVVLPEGFDEHPNAHYPLVVLQDHFNSDFHLFREQPPTAEMKGDRLEVAKEMYRS
jgi:hypothetical protein